MVNLMVKEMNDAGGELAVMNGAMSNTTSRFAATKADIKAHAEAAGGSVFGVGAPGGGNNKDPTPTNNTLSNNQMLNNPPQQAPLPPFSSGTGANNIPLGNPAGTGANNVPLGNPMMAMSNMAMPNGGKGFAPPPTGVVVPTPPAAAPYDEII